MGSVDAPRTIGVAGAGTMGAGIAQLACVAGARTLLHDPLPEALDRGREWIHKRLEREVERGRLTADDATSAKERLSAAPALDDLKPCELVIEAAPESLELKRSLFTELAGRVVSEDCVLATNTSSLLVTAIAAVVKRPERVVGMHFFNPAPVMTLVEVVRPLTASDETIATAKAFVATCGKDAVHVKDRAGFIVNALLFPYLNNAVRMLDHGTASMQGIDTAMKGGCNFPLGPFQLLDLVGLDTSVSILDALYAEFKDPNYTPVPSLRRMVEAGLLGRKSGRGFYDYRS